MRFMIICIYVRKGIWFCIYVRKGIWFGHSKYFNLHFILPLGKVCEIPSVRHGNITVVKSENNILTVGSIIRFRCKPPYFLSGGVSTHTCKSYGYWGHLPDCIDIDVIRNRCTLIQKTMGFKIDPDSGDRIPYCEPAGEIYFILVDEIISYHIS